jgi:Flp pilus assembly protein TadD
VRYRAAQTLSLYPSNEFLSADYRTLRSVLAEIEAVSIDDDRAGLHLMKGSLAERQGLLERAGEEYELAMQLEPTIIGARSNLAVLLDELKQPAEAAHLRQQELDLMERDLLRLPGNAELQRRVGLMRHLHGWHKEAESALLSAALLEPRNPAMLETLAIYYGDTDRSQEAISLLERILKLKPKHPRFKQELQELQNK